MPTLPRVAALASLAGIGLAACGAGGSHPTSATPAGHQTPTTMMAMQAAQAADPTTPPAVTDHVAISNFSFAPAAVTVKSGTTITWTNKDDEPHTVFFAFDSSRSPILVNSANVYTKTFTTPGTYTYHCTIHPFMTGTVVVTA